MHRWTWIVAVVALPTAAAAVEPVELGRSSNAYTALGKNQHMVAANSDTGAVVFVHRQDVTVHGGGTEANGQLRIDISTDGGRTFTNDVGVLNPAHARETRYPNATLHDLGATDGLRLVWLAPTSVDDQWDGLATGVGSLDTTAPAGSEADVFPELWERLPASLTAGAPGEFWFTARTAAAAAEIAVYKGVVDETGETIEWSRSATIDPPHDTSVTGVPQFGCAPDIAFSPDGATAWLSWCGDLEGGHTGGYSPVLMKSEDGGDTWGEPVEVDLPALPVRGRDVDLETLWNDATIWQTEPEEGGDPVDVEVETMTTAFHADLTVDAGGNPHFFSLVGAERATGADDGDERYIIRPGLSTLVVDTTSTDGGATFEAVSLHTPFNGTFRGEWGRPDPSTGAPLTMDNKPQLARTEDGSHVFFSWATSVLEQVPFGESTNIAPQLHVAGMRVADGALYGPKVLTYEDPVWDGRVLHPTMAPTVLQADGCFILPIVVMELLEDDILAPTRFWYFGGDASLGPDDLDTGTLCRDTCNRGDRADGLADNGLCEDAGAGGEGGCLYGTDCADCGAVPGIQYGDGVVPPCDWGQFVGDDDDDDAADDDAADDDDDDATVSACTCESSLIPGAAASAAVSLPLLVVARRRRPR